MNQKRTLFIILLLLIQLITPVLALTVVDLPFISEGETIFTEDINDTEIIYFCADDNFITKTHMVFLYGKNDGNKTVNISTEYANITYTQDITWSFLTYYKFDWYFDVYIVNETGVEHINDSGSGAVLLGYLKPTIVIESDLVWLGLGTTDIGGTYRPTDSIFYPSSYVHVDSDVEIVESNVYYKHETRLVEEFYAGQLNPIFRGLYKIVTVFVSDTESRYSFLQILIFFSAIFSFIFFIIKYLVLSPVLLLVLFEGIAMLYSISSSNGDYMVAMRTLVTMNIAMIKSVSALAHRLFTMLYQLLQGIKFW